MSHLRTAVILGGLTIAVYALYMQGYDILEKTPPTGSVRQLID